MPIMNVSDMLASRRTPVIERDYIQGYLEFARSISDGDLDNGRALCGRMDVTGSSQTVKQRISVDGFVETVASYVRRLGYEPVISCEGDAFGVDLAIIHPRTGLYGVGVECEAPLHPMLARARSRELWRPQVLTGSIPKVHRVSCTGWRHALAQEQDRLRIAIETALCSQPEEA